jgi:hypothetical protein
LAFVDEFHSAYTKDSAWRNTAFDFGQQTTFGTFILTGSAPYLRALAFGHAIEEDMKEAFPYYIKVGNLNNDRYTVINMEPMTSKESYAEMANVFGVRQAGKLFGIADDEWLRLLGMATGGLARGTEGIAAQVNLVCNNAQTSLIEAIRSLPAEEGDALKEEKDVVAKLVFDWKNFDLAEKVELLLTCRGHTKLSKIMELPTTLEMGFHTRFFEVEKHMDNNKALLQKLGQLLEAQAQTRQVKQLSGVPWQLMSSVPGRLLKDDPTIGARMLYEASDRGAIRYDGDTVSFGNPMLAQAVLDELMGVSWLVFASDALAPALCG